MEANKPLLVEYGGKLHDLAAFANRHPGGERILREAAGLEISRLLRGEDSLSELRHEHSEAAYRILAKYAIDSTDEQDPLLDGSSAILWKVGKLKCDYWRWIHRPHDGSLRLFESRLLERLTRTVWWMVPIVWMPIIILFASIGIRDMNRSWGHLEGSLLSVALFTLGYFAWTFLEYGLHRGVFHWRPDPQSYVQITLHFLLHGVHHKTPMDPDRLVFPPAAAAIIIAFFYMLYSSILPFPAFCCFGSGKLFGYIVYDMVHYYLHHGSPKPASSWYSRKVYHHNHHYKDSDSGFGISTHIWDHFFGTVGPKRSAR